MTEDEGSKPDGLDTASVPDDPGTEDERFRVLFEHAADVGFVTDPAGVITYVTPSVTRLFGYAPEDLLGMSGRDLFDPHGLAELEQSTRDLVELGSKRTFTTQMRTIDGTLRWVDIDIENLVEHPAVRGYVANARDVTERLETIDALRAMRAQGRAILKRSRDLTMFFERDGTIAWISPNCTELFGMGPEELVGENGLAIIDERDRDRVIGELLSMVNLGEFVRTTFRITTAAGDLRWVEEIATNLIDDPDVGYIVGNVRDVTEQHIATRALAAAEARHRLILDTAQEGIWVTDDTGGTVFANPRMARMLGTTIDVLLAGSLLDFVSPGERPLVAVNDRMTRQGEIRRYETVLVRSDGASSWVSVSAAPLSQEQDDRDERDQPHPAAEALEVLHMVTDITDRKRDEAELRRITLHDDLTGLPNRRLLTDRLGHHLDHEGPRPAAVLVVNVDHFKDINDSLGHRSGDRALIEIADRLRLAARSQDTIARSEGDEFIVLSEDVADVAEAVAIAEHMRMSLHDPIRIGDTELAVTASVGIAMSPPADAEDLIRGAGIAMYRAKANGRDGIAVFDHRNEAEVQERMRLQTDMRRAAANDEFEVWYQPIVGLDDTVVHGVEALLRWRHPTRGLLLPGAFMSVAESTGMIREIGRDVLETACRDAAAWKDTEHPVRVSVNIAAAQVVDQELCTQVADVIARTGIDPGWLTLEITESAALTDQATAEQNLQCLRSLGVRLALDDFGTGYSSLSFLRRLPVTVLKIDQSFVAGLGERREDELIVAGVISMGNAMGHAVIAEGIETTRQRDALLGMGCHYGQGFLWSRAVPLSDLASTIATIELAHEEPSGEDAAAHAARVDEERPIGGARTLPELGAAAFDSLPTAAAVLDDAGIIIATNRAWRRFATMNGASLDETGVGADYLSVCERSVGADGIDGVVASGLREVLSGERQQFDVEYLYPSPMQDRLVRLQAVPNGGSGLVISHTDISASTPLESRFVLLGDGDALTGLPNGTLLESCLDRMREEALRIREPLAVLCCDLSGPDEVAHALGHAADGGLLAQIVGRIARVVRDGDIVARANNAQFIIACAHLEAADRGADDIARRIEEMLARPFQLGAHRVSISAKVGYVTDDGSHSAAILLRRARAATDAAKAAAPAR